MDFYVTGKGLQQLLVSEGALDTLWVFEFCFCFDFFFYARSTMHYNLRNVKEKLPEICHSKIHIVPDNPSDSLELHTY